MAMAVPEHWGHPVNYLPQNPMVPALPPVQMIGKYHLLGKLGEGAYGEVYLSQLLGLDGSITKVAIKIIKNEPASYTFEVDMLLRLRGSPVIVWMYDYFMIDQANLDGTVNTLGCIVFEYLPCSLKEASLKFIISLEHIFCIFWDILETLKTLSSMSIIHRDIKPDNLMLANGPEFHAKLIDFGCSCIRDRRGEIYEWQGTQPDGSICPSPGDVRGFYTVTRWYRPPEVILAIPKWQSGYIDIWSLGCTLFELYFKLVIFKASSSLEVVHMIEYIFSVKIPKKMVKKARYNEVVYFDKPSGEKVLREYTLSERTKLHCDQVKKIFETQDPEPKVNMLLNLIKKMLCPDPSKRPTFSEIEKDSVWKISNR